MRSGAALAVALAVLSACEPDEPSFRTRRAEPAVEPDEHESDEHEAADHGAGEHDTDDGDEPEAPRDADRACALGIARPLASEAAIGLAVAAHGEDRVVVLERTEGALLGLSPRDSGAPRRREIPRARGESIFAFEPAGERFLLVGRAPCTRGGVATECLVARTVSTTLAAGAPVDVALPSAIRTLRVFASGSLLYVAHSHADGAPGLERFEARDDGTVVTTHWAFGEAVPEGEPVEILGLTADGAGWAVLYRHGATEDAASAVVLATQLDEHEIGELHDALLVESIAWVGTSLAMIVAFEFARPSWLRLGADGEVLTAPQALPPGDEPPLPFAGRRTARVGGDPEERVLEIRDAMGDRVGDRMALGPGTADVARIERGFVVARLAIDGAVELVDVTCP